MPPDFDVAQTLDRIIEEHMALKRAYTFKTAEEHDVFYKKIKRKMYIKKMQETANNLMNMILEMHTVF